MLHPRPLAAEGFSPGSWVASVFWTALTVRQAGARNAEDARARALGQKARRTGHAEDTEGAENADSAGDYKSLLKA